MATDQKLARRTDQHNRVDRGESTYVILMSTIEGIMQGTLPGL